jgi:hypothetical protein
MEIDRMAIAKQPASEEMASNAFGDISLSCGNRFYIRAQTIWG